METRYEKRVDNRFAGYHLIWAVVTVLVGMAGIVLLLLRMQVDIWFWFGVGFFLLSILSYALHERFLLHQYRCRECGRRIGGAPPRKGHVIFRCDHCRIAWDTRLRSD